jgi:acetyl esterase
MGSSPRESAGAGAGALAVRVQRAAARALLALPPALQVRLSGKPAVRIDGETLAPETQLILALLERRPLPPLETVTPAQARITRRQQAALYGGAPEPVGSVRDLQLDLHVGLRARHYAPADPGGPQPLLVFFHGGGFVFGDLDTHDGLCRLLCAHAGAHVLAVDYRLAPEHPFPAPVEDAVAALAWAHANAAALGADPGRIGVGGDSAGGNLAAVAVQLEREAGGPAAVLQLLIYPVTDFTGWRASRELFGEGFFLTNAEMDWFEAHYLGGSRELASDPRASPLLAAELAGLPPALVVTAAFDPLRDEGEEYAHALSAAGVPTVLRRFPGVIHGFVSATGVSRSAREAVIEIAGMARAMLAQARLPAAGDSRL